MTSPNTLIADLQSENAALRENAERYRYLRERLEDSHFENYAPEPWWIDGGTIIKANNHIPAQATNESNAIRIVACVNACSGIPTYQLFAENDKPLNLGEQIDFLRRQRDELIASLKRIAWESASYVDSIEIAKSAIGQTGALPPPPTKLTHNPALLVSSMREVK